MKQTIISACAILALLSSCSHGASENPGIGPSCIQPAALKEGDKIALISPSYHTAMENVDTAAMILRNWGFEPVVGPNVGKEYRGAYAGTPKERLADLKWALKDPDIKAILCNRGGYGTIHLVDLLKEETIATHPKSPLFVSVMGVMAFILAGFNHCIADAFYLLAGGTLTWTWFATLLGNACGGALLGIPLERAPEGKNE